VAPSVSVVGALKDLSALEDFLLAGIINKSLENWFHKNSSYGQFRNFQARSQICE